jgi:hydroxyacylglutathione hydrolase
VPGAINIGARPEASVWAGWMLDPEMPILLILDDDTDLSKVVPLFLRTGYTRFAGYLTGGMKAWGNAGMPLKTLAQESVHQLNQQTGDVQLIDVRSPDEWEEGHIPHARHKFLPELKDDSKDLDLDKPVVTYCDSGYRASLAASLLQAKGFKDVRNVPGSWQAWKNAKFPVTTPAKKKE